MGLVRRAAQPEAAQRAVVNPETLLAQLGDPDPDHRREAALGLGGAAEAIGALLERVATETEATVREAMLTTLAAHDNEQVANGLARYLASDEAGLRTAVAEALASMPVSVPAIVPRLIADPDHDVRVMTAMVLADLPHPAAPTWLAQMIADDPHPNVVASAIDALLPSLTPEHTELLNQAVQRFPEDPFLRFIVETALR